MANKISHCTLLFCYTSRCTSWNKKYCITRIAIPCQPVVDELGAFVIRVRVFVSGMRRTADAIRCPAGGEKKTHTHSEALHPPISLPCYLSQSMTFCSPLGWLPLTALVRCALSLVALIATPTRPISAAWWRCRLLEEILATHIFGSVSFRRYMYRAMYNLYI